MSSQSCLPFLVVKVVRYFKNRNLLKCAHVRGGGSWGMGVTKDFLFFEKKFEDISPFCGATDTSVLDLW